MKKSSQHLIHVAILALRLLTLEVPFSTLDISIQVSVTGQQRPEPPHLHKPQPKFPAHAGLTHRSTHSL
jgi:hypothetical protein